MATVSDAIIHDSALIERFWSKVKKSDSCWEWTASTSRGYGGFHIGGKHIKAHRFAYIVTNGSIPEGLVLDHLCRNRACVNPAHLEPVTLQENIARGEGLQAINARKTHCCKGHPLEGKNVRVRKLDGARICRACVRAINYKRRGTVPPQKENIT